MAEKAVYLSEKIAEFTAKLLCFSGMLKVEEKDKFLDDFSKSVCNFLVESGFEKREITMEFSEAYKKLLDSKDVIDETEPLEEW